MYLLTHTRSLIHWLLTFCWYLYYYYVNSVVSVRNFVNAEDGFRSTIDSLETNLRQQKVERESVDRVCKVFEL